MRVEQFQGRQKIPSIWCDHCNKPHHSRETCWKIHGKPANWKGKHEGRFNRLPLHMKSRQFPSEQMDHLLLRLLKSNSGSSGTPNASLSQTSTEPNAQSCCCLSNSTPWIIDFGASDHMTSFSPLIHTYVQALALKKIRIADGSYSPIAGKGLFNLSKIIVS